ncbi:MAG: hypothetical protein ACI8RD_002424 [Bacillariaceae sp.]|jgi:hypothetical protein
MSTITPDGTKTDTVVQIRRQDLDPEKLKADNVSFFCVCRLMIDLVYHL